jgi:hypothetical protein
MDYAPLVVEDPNLNILDSRRLVSVNKKAKNVAITSYLEEVLSHVLLLFTTLEVSVVHSINSVPVG